MSYDDQFCRDMRIKLDEPLDAHCERMREDPQAYVTAEVAIEIRPAGEPGFVMLSQEHCWALLNANRAVAQLATDRLKALTNWIERAGESSREKDQWRRAFWVLAVGIAGVTVVRVVWDWLAS